jgi:HK97 family phage major capsid protein
MQHRAFALQVETRAEGEADDGRVAIKFSSSNPVKRMAWGQLWWYEVLSHEPGAVVTDRLKQGIAALVNHDINQRAGILEDGVIANGEGRGNVRFNSTQIGKDTRTEVAVDKTLPWISVGYIVHSEARVADIDPTDDEDPDYLGTWEADSWEPCETSFVAIPADITAGVGRDLATLSPTIPQYPVRFAGVAATPPAQSGRSKENSMPEPVVIPAVAAVTVSADHTEVVRSERERTVGISLLARQFPDILTRELADKAINEGHTRDAVAALVLEKKREKEATINASGAQELSNKERGEYSIVRGINTALRGLKGGSTENSLEIEVSDTIAKRLGRETSGFFVPTNEPVFRLSGQELRARALVTSSSGAGGATVATELVSFLDLLRPRLSLANLGAEFMGGCSSNFSLPKMTGDVGFNWVGENPGTDNTDTDPTFGQVAFSPLGATASTSWSRQLLIQSSIDIEAKVRNALLLRGAIGIETAALQGSGGTQPTGLLSTTGVHVIALGTNGANPTKQNFIDMLTACAVANAELGDMQKYLVTEQTAGYLAGQPELGNTIALPTYTYSSDGKGRINGHEAARTNLLPINLTKGTAAGVCRAAIGGSWSALTIAEWGAMEIILDPYTGAKQSLVKIIANFLVDSNCTYPQAFSVILDSLQ